MTTKRSVRSGPDPRDMLLLANTSRHSRVLPDAVLDDLRHFRKRADEGRVITWQALTRWLVEQHDVTIGRQGLSTIAKANGIAPWWKV